MFALGLGLGLLSLIQHWSNSCTLGTDTLLGSCDVGANIHLFLVWLSENDLDGQHDDQDNQSHLGHLQDARHIHFGARCDGLTTI